MEGPTIVWAVNSMKTNYSFQHFSSVWCLEWSCFEYFQCTLHKSERRRMMIQRFWLYYYCSGKAQHSPTHWPINRLAFRIWTECFFIPFVDTLYNHFEVTNRILTMMLIVLYQKSVKEIKLPAENDCDYAPNIRLSCYIYWWQFWFQIFYLNDESWMTFEVDSFLLYFVNHAANLIWFLIFS